MCWESNSVPEVKIAKEDIKTFKVMYRDLEDEELFSYFFYKLYSIGKITSKITLSYKKLKYESSSYCIYLGYHSYDINIKCKHYYNSERGVYIVKVGNVEEYYIEPFSNIFQTLCIVECTIPKDSKYYLNEKGEYVSEQIIVDKILAEY